MILLKILPGVLKELSKHVPSILFKTVEWSELASEIPKVSRRILQKEGHDELYQAQEKLLGPFHIILTQDKLDTHKLNPDKIFGEKVLQLYFLQLFSPHGIFLDIRPHHFNNQDSRLIWHPSNLWVQFEEDFKTGLLKVYEGFYLENDTIYLEGLEQIGLLKKSFPEKDKQELATLFKNHFGQGLTQDMTFHLSDFRDSIIKMSEFLLSKEVQISKDFIYLGIYLVCLYSSLEKTKDPLPVKKIYLDVRSRF